MCGTFLFPFNGGKFFLPLATFKGHWRQILERPAAPNERKVGAKIQGGSHMDFPHFVNTEEILISYAEKTHGTFQYSVEAAAAKERWTLVTHHAFPSEGWRGFGIRRRRHST